MSTQSFLIKVVWRFVSRTYFIAPPTCRRALFRSDPLTANVQNTAQHHLPLLVGVCSCSVGDPAVAQTALPVAQTVGVQIRPRRATDLPQCVDALAEVQRADAYPQRWPVDPAAWLDPSDSLAAWVADSDGAILGHVVVTACTDDPTLAQTIGRPISELARVSRLFVTPAGRGSGLARDLLTQAGSFAVHAGFGLVLDVVDGSANAIAVYEHLGWRLVELRPAVWTTVDGLHPLLRLYVLP